MISGETIWVTGASSGIGQQLALQLAEQGNKVIASGRNQQRLQTLQAQHANITPLAIDLVDAQADWISQQLGAVAKHLDRIILSAGDCIYFEIDAPDWEIMQKVMDINFHGTVKSIQAALPLLKNAPQRGHIVAISSLATAAAFPRAEAYGASKAALSYFLSSLRIDLAADNIDVSDIKPGFIDTPLTQANDFDMPFLMSSEQAAKRILNNIHKRPYEYVFPKRLNWLFKLLSAMPKLWLKMNKKSTSEQEV